MARHRSGLSFRQSLVLAVMAAACAPSSAQQQPPALPSCPPVQVSLSPCVTYFIGNSSSPSAECCSQIQAMLLSQAPCLCAAVAAAPSQLGLVLGQAQALLPASCNLPPLNACTAVTGTSPAPAGGSTAPSSGTTAAAADAPVSGPSGTVPAEPSGGGLKSVPALLGSAAAGRHGGISAAAILISFLVAYVF